MIAFLDTRAAVRFSDGRARIGIDAARLIERAETLVSPMVLVELEYLYEIGRMTLPAKDILRKLEHEIGLSLCDLSFVDFARVVLDEKWTCDGFDRIFVAQARLKGLAPLITTDEKIADHYPRTVWELPVKRKINLVHEGPARFSRAFAS